MLSLSCSTFGVGWGSGIEQPVDIGVLGARRQIWIGLGLFEPCERADRIIQSVPLLTEPVCLKVSLSAQRSKRNQAHGYCLAVARVVNGEGVQGKITASAIEYVDETMIAAADDEGAVFRGKGDLTWHIFLFHWDGERAQSPVRCERVQRYALVRVVEKIETMLNVDVAISSVFIGSAKFQPNACHRARTLWLRHPRSSQ